jgi:hypothetical protein
MANLPKDVVKAMRATVYSAADEAKYVGMSRGASGLFLNQLVADKDVGGRLEMYMPKQEIRHYIKDAILNRYSKDRRRNALLVDCRNVITEIFGIDTELSDGNGDVSLYRSPVARGAQYVVVSNGTYLKWETALRKALMFVAKSPFSRTAASVRILLLLHAQGKIVPGSDKDVLNAALSRCGAAAFIFAE